MGEVDLPPTVIRAHREGSLVLFVGAGASIPAPSSLPDFATLTRRIATESGLDVTDAELLRPDVVLGAIERRPVAVHGRIASIVGDPASGPSEIHTAIARLATAKSTVRVVTTNYDPHLTTELRATGHDVREYFAPALPLGDNFEGLAYLHGCIRHDPRMLVATDHDFGDAYLRAAWAARFLERMFATYTVLFVGYSHSDVIVTYLARALGPSAVRFILTDHPEDSLWSSLGIHPVGYPNDDGRHNALIVTLQRWGTRAAMGFLDHQQQIATLVAEPPPLNPETLSYLEEVVATPELATIFTQLARGREWLLWTATRPELKLLFDPRPTPSETSSTLAGWLADHFITDPDLSDDLFNIAADLGGRVGPTLWGAIGHKLHMLGSPRTRQLDQWVVMLLHNEPSPSRDWLELALTASTRRDDTSLAIELFDHLTRPVVAVERTMRTDGSPSFNIELPSSKHHLREAWRKVFVPRLDELANETIAIADRHLRRAHHLLTSAGAATPGWDPVSFSRSSIAPHQQDQHRDAFNVVIDAARDSLCALLHHDPPVGQVYLAAWGRSNVPLLRRLAVHGWTCRPDATPSERLVWIRAENRLWDHQLQHEVFQLVADAVKEASQADLAALVADVAAGPEPRGEFADHRVYTLLEWITRHRPDSDAAQGALATVQAAHPEFMPGEHPDFGSWFEIGFVGPRTPIPVDELNDLLRSEPAAAIARLASFQSSEDFWSGPTWDDAQSNLANVVRRWPDLGYIALDHLTDGDIGDALTRAVIRGWADADLDDDEAETIAQRILQLEVDGLTDNVARLLDGGNRNDRRDTPWPRVPAARELATATWNAEHEPALAPQSSLGWLAVAINHSAGRLAQFWLQALSNDWRQAGEHWTGLNPGLRDEFERMLSTDDDRGRMAQVIFASQLHFLNDADTAWCRQHVLPLFDWDTHADQALRAWSGYLEWGRWNDRLLTDGLLHHYLTAARHVHALSDHQRQRLAGHLASIALHSEHNPLRDGWLMNMTAELDPETRVRLIDEIAESLSQLDPTAIETAWQTWMRDYWQQRLNSIPIAVTDDEATSLAGWTVALDNSFDEAVRLATARPINPSPHGSLLRDLRSGTNLVKHPASAATLVAHVLRGTAPQSFYDADTLADIARALKPHTDVGAIIEEAIRLGLSEAPSW